jgi:hypothetical protein
MVYLDNGLDLTPLRVSEQMDRYGHLFPDGLDQLATHLDRTRSTATAAALRPAHAKGLKVID